MDGLGRSIGLACASDVGHGAGCSFRHSVTLAVVEATCFHLCRGNWRSRWLFSGSLEPLAERMFQPPFDTFLVEWEDTTREGDYSTLRYVPDGPIVAKGIVSSKSNIVESDDEVLRRMDDAAGYLDLDQLALSPQCGFASAAEGTELDETTQWRKLELIGRVAERLWGRP